MDELNGRQRRFLRGLGNQLEATVYVGRDGISTALGQTALLYRPDPEEPQIKLPA